MRISRKQGHRAGAYRSLLCAVLAAAGCGEAGAGADDANENAGGDVDSDADVDSDSDADTDADSDTDADTDTSSDTDTGAEDAGNGECDTDEPVTFYLSADDSNSMAGAAEARALIRQGQLVFKGLRTYEFTNYYTFDYPAPQPEHLAVSAEMRDNEDGTYNLQIGVRAPDPEAAPRRPANVVLSIDTSSSMAWGDPGSRAIDRAIDSCRAIAGALRAGDVVSLVTWDLSPSTTLAPRAVGGPDDPALLAACGSLAAYGETDFHAGLAASYDLAAKSFDPEWTNRVILISDGGANVGETDAARIAAEADDAEGEAIYLIGVGVGDPWNYNDDLLDAVTDAGKGAYVFIDSAAEAESILGARFDSLVEVAARNVAVRLDLPPTFAMEAFHGEQHSTNPEEVEPQHLALGDAMVFHQVLRSCDPSALDADLPIRVTASYEDPATREKRSDVLDTTLGALLGGPGALLRKGDAVVAYAEALKALRGLSSAQAVQLIDAARATVSKAAALLAQDPELVEIGGLLALLRKRYDGTASAPEPGPPPASEPIVPSCAGCDAVGTDLDALRCAVELCDPAVFRGQEYSSPTGAATPETRAAVARFGATGNDLAPRMGGSYAVMATGPVAGTAHSTWLSQTSGTDALSKSAQIYDAVEWRLHLKAPEHANGFRIHHAFFSEEYDDFIGTDYNDKFYIILEAGSTRGGEPTVINFAGCRDPASYTDFVCGDGIEYCTPGERYCYIAINTALSECCWKDGCPDGKATTDISGTGFECAARVTEDGEGCGSSTGWMVTEWPIEPGEEFDLVFHLHDTADGIYDSAAIIDQLLFLDTVRPGTEH